MSTRSEMLVPIGQLASSTWMSSSRSCWRNRATLAGPMESGSAKSVPGRQCHIDVRSRAQIVDACCDSRRAIGQTRQHVVEVNASLGSPAEQRLIQTRGVRRRSAPVRNDACVGGVCYDLAETVPLRADGS